MDYYGYVQMTDEEVAANKYVGIEKGKILQESNQIFKSILANVEEEYRDESKNIRRYEHELYYLRQDFYKSERKLKRAEQLFEYTPERIEECRSLQEKCNEDVKKTREVVEIQKFHLQEETKRLDGLSNNRADRERLNEVGVIIARKFYEERNSRSKIAKAFRKVLGMDRAVKRSLNDKINSMLGDIEEKEEETMSILKRIQRNSGRKSFFARFRGRQSDPVGIDEGHVAQHVVQQAQIKLLA